MNITPINNAQIVNGNVATQAFMSWLNSASLILVAAVNSGSTAARPTSNLWVGQPYFDVSLGIPIWYSGSHWVNSSGATV